jgi:hypothetical protein
VLFDRFLSYFLYFSDNMSININISRVFKLITETVL